MVIVNGAACIFRIKLLKHALVLLLFKILEYFQILLKAD